MAGLPLRTIPNWRISLCARQIEAGGVIAYPTEAVWGLGCDPWSATAVQQLLHLKGRPSAKGLILIAHDMAAFGFLLDDLPEALRIRLYDTWPGPVTWLVPHQGRVPPWLYGQHGSIALRVTDHPQVRQLCQRVGPLVSTSANPAGRPAARTRLRLQQYFGTQLDDMLPGDLGGLTRPSTIRDLTTDTLLRT